MMEDPAIGIKKKNEALTKLETEFRPASAEIKSMQAKYEGLLATIKTQGAQTSQASVDEAERLANDLKFKAEDVQSRYNKRHS